MVWTAQIVWILLLWTSLLPSSKGLKRGVSSSSSPSSLVGSSVIYQSGDTALLPCDISVPTPRGDDGGGSSANGNAAAAADELRLIMWYREDVKSPIYSIDARSGSRSVRPGSIVSDPRSHWIDTNLFGGGHDRVVFDVSGGPARARLRIYNVSEADDGIYRCMVDFKASQTRTSRTNLTVIVRPSKPLIRAMPNSGSKGRIVQGYLGPFQIGTRLTLLCQVIGGKPRPRVVWYRDDRPLSTPSWTGTDPGSGLEVVNNNLTMDLARSDLQTQLTCETSNFDATVLRTSVEIDLKYQAHNVSIVGKGVSLRAGGQHEFSCVAFGSRPAAAITWWFDQTIVKDGMEGVHVRASSTGETSTSSLMYTPRPSDSGRVMRCRATNPEMNVGVLEDSWTLDVQYPPIVSIQLGRSLVAADIRQGNDVYFNCDIRANPAPKTKIVTWLHNGEVLKQRRNSDPRARLVLPSVNDPGVLVLQGVKKAARGNYSCRVGNGVPTYSHVVESQPIFLDVKFPPVCMPRGVKVYGVAKMETAHIACRVEANPPQVAFRWTFNNSAEAKQVEERFIRTNGSTSVLTFTPTRTLEYGTLMCWSSNTVGQQKEPCVFHIIAAGKPEAVQNCSVVNESTDSFTVNCAPGFNGGLPQQFRLGVYLVKPSDGARVLVANLTSAAPRFSVTGLQPGSNYLGEIVGFNVKGVGVPTIVRVYTLKLPEKLIPPILAEPAPNNKLQSLELNPWMLTLLGIGAGVLVVIVLVAVAIRVHASRGGRAGRRRRCTEQATNKVVVTTIEELDLDSNAMSAAAAQGIMLLESDNGAAGGDEMDNGKQRKSGGGGDGKNGSSPRRPPPGAPFDDFGADVHGGHRLKQQRQHQQHQPLHQHQHQHHQRQQSPRCQAQAAAAAEAAAAAASASHFCTMRRTGASGMLNSGSGRRAVQFADQPIMQQTRKNSVPTPGDGSPGVPAQLLIRPSGFPTAAVVPHTHAQPRNGAANPAFMYATLRPGQQRLALATTPDASTADRTAALFHEFIPPPPPPMFEGPPPPPPPPPPRSVAGPEGEKTVLLEKKRKTESAV